MVASASRPRATAGSLENLVRLEGRFYMGNESIEALPTDGEGPMRQVTLSPFYVSVRKMGLAKWVSLTSFLYGRVYEETNTLVVAQRVLWPAVASMRTR